MKQLRVALFCVFAFLSTLPAETLRDQLKIAQEAGDELAEIELIRRILDQEPKDAILHERLADLWISIEDYDMAEKTVKEWKDAPPFVTASIMADVLYYRDKKRAEAVKLLEDYHQKDPSDAVLTRQLVGFLVEMGENQKIVTLLQPLQNKKEDADLFVSRAVAARNLNDYEAALQDYATAKSLDSDAAGVSSNSAAFDRLEKAAPGLRDAATMLQENPKDFVGLLARAYWLLYANFGSDLAFESATAARQIDPGSAAATLLYAFAGNTAGKFSAMRAREECGADINRSLPSSDVMRQLVGLDLQLQQKPKDPALLVARAALLNHEAVQYGLALRDAAAVLEIDPRDNRARLEEMYSLLKLKDPSFVEAEYRQLEANKATPDQLASGCSFLVEALFATSRFEAALEYANRAIKLRPQIAHYYKQRAAVLQKLNRAPQAEADLAKARSLERKSR